MPETKGRNLRGQNGRVNITTTEQDDRVVDIDGMKFQIGRMVAEELLSALSTSLRPFAGYSIFENIMEENDAVLDRLMAGEPADDGRDPGRAEAHTMDLAIIRNPHQPDYPAEKEYQMERYAKRNRGADEVDSDE